MEKEIREILYHYLQEFHPETDIVNYSNDTDLTKIFPFSSFEWMVVICELENKLNLHFNEDFFTKRTIKAMENLK